MRRVVELTVGLGLLLGPLVYALTLEPTSAPAECIPINDEPVTGDLPRYQPPEPITIEVVTEPVEVQAPEPKPDLAAMLFVTDAGVVLSREAEREWGKGRLFEPEGEVTYRAAKRADASKVPAALWSMRGRTFDLYGADGKVCVARLGELRVVGQYDGWSLGGVLGDEWRDQDPAAASKAEIREGLWRRDDLWLVAEIESSDSCKGALWARDAELPPPTILRQSYAPTEASEARLVEFRQSDDLAVTERNYRDAYAELEPEQREYYPTWETLVAEHDASTWSWIDPHGRPLLVGLEFGREPEGCGDPLYSKLTALDHVRGEQFVPVPYGHTPAAVFDADHDGRLELLYSGDDGHWLASASLDGQALVEQDWMCPC